MKKNILTLLLFLLFLPLSEAKIEEPFDILINIESCFNAKNIPTTLKYKSGILDKDETLSIKCVNYETQALIKNLNVRIVCEEDESRAVYYKDKKIIINKSDFIPYKDISGCGFTYNKFLEKENLNVIYIEGYTNFKSIEFFRKYFTFKVNAFQDTYDKNGLNCFVLTSESECMNLLYITITQYLVGWNKLQSYPDAKKAPYFIMKRKYAIH